MISEEDRNVTLFGGSNKQDGNGPRKGVHMNGIWTLLVQDLFECRSRLWIAVAVEFSKKVLAT
jgi:hypothetical protein